MNKQEFLAQLRRGLAGLPQEDIEERLIFYSEMIDDRVEEGLPETEAVSEIGSANKVAAQILAETPLTKLVKEKVKPQRRLKAWEIALIVLGSPLWLSLLLAMAAIILSVYIILWSVAVVFWSAETALAAGAAAGIILSIFLMFKSSALTGLAMLGAGICCVGLSIFMFFGCKAISKGILWLTKRIALGIKTIFVGKVAVQ